MGDQPASGDGGQALRFGGASMESSAQRGSASRHGGAASTLEKSSIEVFHGQNPLYDYNQESTQAPQANNSAQTSNENKVLPLVPPVEAKEQQGTCKLVCGAGSEYRLEWAGAASLMISIGNHHLYYPPPARASPTPYLHLAKAPPDLTKSPKSQSPQL